jgi:hypothetical protein
LPQLEKGLTQYGKGAGSDLVRVGFLLPTKLNGLLTKEVTMNTLLSTRAPASLENRGFSAADGKPAVLGAEQQARVIEVGSASACPATDCCEESLVADGRADLTPAQMVERKLLSLLKGKALPLSHMQMVRALRGRGTS